MSSGLLQSILTRLDALEQAQQPAGPEALNPNYLTVTPGGRIGANFSGKVSASELDLIGGAGASPIKWLTTAGGLLAQLTVDASGNLVLASGTGVLKSQGVSMPAGAGTPNSLQWVRASDGALIALIYGNSQSGSNTMQLTSPAPTGDTSGEINLNAGADLGASSIDLLAQSQAAGGYNSITAHVTKANTGASAGTIVILDSNGNSGLLQTPLGNHKLNYGTGSFLGGGGAPQTITQPHGLGVTPPFFTIFPISWDLAGTAGQPIGWNANPDATNLTFQAWRSGAGFTLNATYFYYWAAGY